MKSPTSDQIKAMRIAASFKAPTDEARKRFADLTTKVDREAMSANGAPYIHVESRWTSDGHELRKVVRDD